MFPKPGVAGSIPAGGATSACTGRFPRECFQGLRLRATLPVTWADEGAGCDSASDRRRSRMRHPPLSPALRIASRSSLVSTGSGYVMASQTLRVVGESLR